MFTKYFDIERLIHSFKTMIACLIGLLITHFIGFTGGQWVVVTIIVVMCAQIYVGSVIQKSYFRFLGTLVGCVFAIIAIVTMGDTFWAAAAAIGISSFCFSYLATAKESLTYAGTLGAVTTAIIMLGQDPTVLFAAERFLEISLGIFIATVMSQFVLPIHARTHIKRTQAGTLTALRDYYSACMMLPRKASLPDYDELEDTIINALSKQRQLAKEAQREPLGESFDQKFFFDSLYCEKEILRSIDFMHHALAHFRDIKELFEGSSALHLFNESVIQAFNTIIHVIETEDRSKEHIHLPAWEQLKVEVEKDQAISLQADPVYVEGFLFAAEQMVSCLKKLAELYQVPFYAVGS